MQVLEKVRAKVAAARRALSTSGEGIEGIREAIRALESERERERGAAVPLAEAVEAVDQLIGRLAAHAQHASLSTVIAAAELGRVASVDLHSRQVGASFGFIVDALRPALRDCLIAALEERYAELQPGLPRDARAERLAELDHQILDLSRQEEQLVNELAESGLAIDRRGDADPRAVLGLDA